MRKVELGTCNRHAELYHLSVISEATLGASYVRLSQKLDIQEVSIITTQCTKLTSVTDLVLSGGECRSKGDNGDGKDNYTPVFPAFEMYFSTASIGNSENTIHIV